MSHHLNFSWLHRQSSPVSSILQTLALRPAGSLHTDISQIRCNLQLPCPSSSSYSLKWIKRYPHNTQSDLCMNITVSFIISVFLSHHDSVAFSEQNASTPTRSSNCFARSSADERPLLVNNAVSGAWSKRMLFKMCTA